MQYILQVILQHHLFVTRGTADFMSGNSLLSESFFRIIQVANAVVQKLHTMSGIACIQMTLSCSIQQVAVEQVCSQHSVTGCRQHAIQGVIPICSHCYDADVPRTAVQWLLVHVVHKIKHASS